MSTTRGTRARRGRKAVSVKLTLSRALERIKALEERLDGVDSDASGNEVEVDSLQESVTRLCQRLDALEGWREALSEEMESMAIRGCPEAERAQQGLEHHDREIDAIKTRVANISITAHDSRLILARLADARKRLEAVEAKLGRCAALSLLAPTESDDDGEDKG